MGSPATWSPDGSQVAWYGFRWPLPPLHHRVAAITVLRAICISDPQGRHVQPLRYSVCSEHCSGALNDPPGQLDWVAPELLLYGNDGEVFAIPVGRKAELVGQKSPVPFAVDAKGDRVAVGAFPASCTSCAGPVRILGVPSGAVVGLVGGTKVDNTEPSLSPDGTKVVFARLADGSGRRLGIWTAAADGSGLRRLERVGANPLWSPAGDRIAYFVPSAASRGTLRLVAPQGGASTTLLLSTPGTVFGWSPDGRRIALDDSGQLTVVDVATGKARKLLRLHLPYGMSSVAWSPDSRQLLVIWRPPTGSGCPSGLWRVPLDGSRPRLVHGC